MSEEYEINIYLNLKAIKNILMSNYCFWEWNGFKSHSRKIDWRALWAEGIIGPYFLEDKAGNAVTSTPTIWIWMACLNQISWGQQDDILVIIIHQLGDKDNSFWTHFQKKIIH